MRYWYICNVGFCASEKHPDDIAFEISASMYTFCHDNLALLDIGMRDGKLHINLDVEAYRQHALAHLHNPNYVTINGKKVFDDEYPFIGLGFYTRNGELCDFDQRSHLVVVQNRNQIYAERRAAVHSAKTIDEIDINLREF